MTVNYKASEIAQAIGAEYNGDVDKLFTGITALEVATDCQLTFATKDFVGKLVDCKAGAAIVAEPVDGVACPLFIVDDVNQALIKVLEMFASEPVYEKSCIEKTAVISDQAEIDADVYIGDFVLLRGEVKIGKGAIIKSGVKIEGPCQIGDNTVIDSNCVIYPRTKIGKNCIILANTTIGSTGFGYRPVNRMPVLIPHNGGVVIEDYVEIGANCCIDRAKFGDTKIVLGTNIDTLCQIDHTVQIGKCTLIAAQCGIAGSTIVGDGCMFAGHSGAKDHVKIGNGVVVGAKSVVVKDAEDGMVIMGMPGRERSLHLRSLAATHKIPELIKRLKILENRVEQNESKDD